MATVGNIAQKAPTHQTWDNLGFDIRVMIWEFLYENQQGRIVEVDTAAHPHCEYDHRWCPRISASPRPYVVNVCQEARLVTHKLAQRAGHLMYGTADDLAPIYFNPAIDTLSVLNNVEYWIRDWGSEGILTQFQMDHSPANLRFLAIELEPLNRGSTGFSLQLDLHGFPHLEEMVFLVSNDNPEVREWVRRLDKTLMRWDQEQRLFPDQFTRAGVRNTICLVAPMRLKGCRMAKRVGGRLSYF